VEDLLLFLHVLAAFWYVMGVAAVQLSYIRAVRAEALDQRIAAVEEAFHYQGVLLVPGAIALGFSGAFYWADRDYNLLTTGWLLALEAMYLVTLFACLPLIGVGLRRARIAALKARRSESAAAELERVLADGVPLVFGGLATALVVGMTAVSVFRP
jgi:uncharacterized membrane protein